MKATAAYRARQYIAKDGRPGSPPQDGSRPHPEGPLQRKRETMATTPSDETGPAVPPADRRALEGPAGVPVVGIGASAGGLEALEAFFHAMPTPCGVAFVVVQHFDPAHESHLAPLLQRTTPHPVREAQDGMAVAPDHVYILPPNAELVLERGHLRVTPPSSPHGLRTPIDVFLRSLAGELGPRAVGVVLSGMGHDGTAGLAAIKAAGGTTFVQSPATARFDGMPRSAIDAGVADVEGPVASLPARILDVVHGTPVAPAAAADDEGEAMPGLEQVVTLLRQRTGHDFSGYKPSTLSRRIEHRMQTLQVDRVDAFLRLLRAQPAEVEALFQELLISVTSFFRDPEVWESLRDRVLPALIAASPPGTPIRAWVPGCATGEEAYTLAMVCREALEREDVVGERPLQIFATDLDRVAIEKARTGLYSTAAVAAISPERQRRFFLPVARGLQVAPSIRESVIFAQHNVLFDPPFTRLDLISCRNLLIYLTPELQAQLLPRLHRCLNRGGILLLGSAETAGHAEGLFTSVDGKARIYRRIGGTARDEPPGASWNRPRTEAVGAPRRPVSAPLTPELELPLLRAVAPTAVLTDERGDVLYVSGSTGDFLEPTVGATPWNLLTMARAECRVAVARTFRQALAQDAPASAHGLVAGHAGSPRTFGLTVQRVREPAVLRGCLLALFTDEPPAATRPAGAGVPGTPEAALAEDLARALDELHATRDEMQRSNEELGAANEELQSANEELQSTNEELMTSKEEMQSMNEELQTLNQELQSRVDDLSRITNDMKNLLDSTDIAAVFLDLALHVRLFSAGSRRLFSLIAGDIGRPLADFACALQYPTLVQDAAEVLRTLVIEEREASTADGHWYQVRLLPYRTLDDRVDGIVITFADITAAKQLEAQLRSTQEGLQRHILEQDRRLPPRDAPP